MTDSNYTAMLVILDRSGSMWSIRTDMEGGVRQLIAGHAGQPGMVTVDLVTFDDVIEHTHAFADPAEVKVVLEPRGSTALYDAIGVSFAGFGAALAALPEHARPDTVLVTIVTDGYENASREYTAHDVKRLIETQRDVYDWDVSFIGANQDAVLEAQRIGVDAKDALTYDVASVAPMMAAHTAKQLRRRAGDKTGYTAAERGAAKPESR
ncbi:VWA domain-containing protein [Microbacterium sp. BWT-B31]|uniref:VWA domain-containing protein n=1 Tax=Microbacterium sp. BWT-B31 TaxID=3232072 RepID=UPI0035294AAE